jgi:hypothetical protein
VITKTAIINDLHAPFHDPQAVGTALDIIADAHVDRIVINGDLLDMYNVNSHGPAHPMTGTLLEDEIAFGRLWLAGLRKRFPKKEIVFLFGNHEDRLERFIIQHAKALFKLISLQNLLGLKDLDISYYPYNHRYRLEKTNVYIQHSPPSYGKNGAMTSLERDVDQTSIYGCSHRLQHVCKTSKSGVTYDCYYNGWLGSTRLSAAHARVFHYAKGHENWQQCFALVTVEDGKRSFIEQIPIRNGEALYGGFIYG